MLPSVESVQSTGDDSESWTGFTSWDVRNVIPLKSGTPTLLRREGFGLALLAGEMPDPDGIDLSHHKIRRRHGQTLAFLSRV